MVKDNLKRIMISLDEQSLRDLDDLCFKYHCNASIIIAICIDYIKYRHDASYMFPNDFYEHIRYYFGDIANKHSLERVERNIDGEIVKYGS